MHNIHGLLRLATLKYVALKSEVILKKNFYSYRRFKVTVTNINSDTAKVLNKEDSAPNNLTLSARIVNAAPNSVRPYLKLARYDRPVGSWLLYWPCAWSIASAAEAGCLPDLYMLFLFGSGAVIMRGAGCTINDMIDKDIDHKVYRTQKRPLVSGVLSLRQAWFLLAAQLSIGLAILLQLNWYSVLLGASSLSLVITYPLMKRFTYWPQFMLGLTLNWGALLGYSAVQGYLNVPVCVPLYLAGVCWTLMYDTIYAHQDRYDDLRIGLKSTAILFGEKTKLWLLGFTGAMITNLSLSGYMNEQSWPYFASIGLLSAHLINQLITVDINNPTDCDSKFISNIQVGFILFCGIVVGTLFKKEKTTKTKALKS